MLLCSWMQATTCLHPCLSCWPLLIMLCCFFVEHGDIDQETALAAAHGFTGCLSAVQFSHIAPLKAALQSGHPAPITVTGHVTESSCVAPAGTDATSRERTHSFAGDFRLSPSLVINGNVQSGQFHSCDSQDGFRELLLCTLQVSLSTILFWSLDFRLICS